jgi:Protein of unknown function (DUF3618)
VSSDKIVVPSSTVPRPRTVAEIERDLEATRNRLGETINELQSTLSPSRLAERSKVKAKALVTDDNGEVSPEKVARIAAGAVAGLVAVAVTVRLGRAAKRVVFGNDSRPQYIYIPVARDQIQAV